MPGAASPKFSIPQLSYLAVKAIPERLYSVPQLRKLSPIRLLSGSESEVLVTAAEDKLGLHLVISGLMSLTGKKGTCAR